MMNIKYGISSLVFLPESLQSSMDKIVKNNFDCWEVVCEGSHELNRGNIDYLKKLKDEYNNGNVEISIHAPFSDLNPCSMNDRIRKLTVDCIRDSIIGGYELGCKIITIHPGYAPPLWSKFTEDLLDNNYTVLREIVSIAEEYDITVGLENMPNYPGVFGVSPEDLRNIIRDIDTKHLGITYDIGHGNTFKGIDNATFIKELNKIGKGIVHIHCHDNNGKEDEHLKVGDGSIDFKSVFKVLKEIEYNGVVVMESKNIRDGIISRDRIKNIVANL